MTNENEEITDRYGFGIDDGVHFQIEKRFPTIEEATKFFKDEVKEAEKDPEKYFHQSKEDWTDDCFPHIELHTIEDSGYGEEIEAWQPDYDDEEEED